MAICMHEVMLDQHLEKSIGSHPGDELIHWISIFFVVGYWSPFNIGHYKNFFSRFGTGDWEQHSRIAKNLVKFFQILFFLPEIELFLEHLLEGLFVNRNLEYFGEKREEATDSEHQCDIFFNISVNIRMANLNCYLFSID